MIQRIESRWVALRRNAIEKAEHLAWAASKDFPTNLGRIATRQRVEGIQFRPLLTDGGVAVTQHGFLIYVKADLDEAENLTRQLDQDGTGTGLPRQILRRTRFTVAHEIAHTFFYDTTSTPPKLKVPLKNASSVKSLERVCNSVAGALLVPEIILERKFSNSDLTDPRELSRIADLALVSKHALVRRLQELQRFPRPIGIVACIEWREQQWIIDSVYRHYSLRQLLTSGKEGAPLSALVDHPDFLPNGGELPEVDVELNGPAGSLKIRFLCNESLRPNDRGSIFVTGVRRD